MISRTFGAPLGGTTDGGQYGLESLAVSLITPPNFGGSGGNCLPSSVIVALGEPGVPVICWAKAVVVSVITEHAASKIVVSFEDVCSGMNLPIFSCESFNPRLSNNFPLSRKTPIDSDHGSRLWLSGG